MVDLSSKGVRTGRPRIGQYLVGALSGTTPLLFLALALTFVDSATLSSWSTYLRVLVFGFMFVGGIMAGFIVARVVSSRHLLVGLVAGMFSYLLSLVYALFLLQFLLSRDFNIQLQLFSYVTGGAVGGFMAQKLRK